MHYDYTINNYTEEWSEINIPWGNSDSLRDNQYKLVMEGNNTKPQNMTNSTECNETYSLKWKYII